MTLEKNFGTVPEPLRQGPFCPSRFRVGNSAYEPLFWGGNVRQVQPVYQPSGKVSPGYLFLFLLSPLVLGIAAVWISNQLVPLLGWVIFGVDPVLAFSVFTLLFLQLRHCRNPIASCISAVLAMVLAGWGFVKTGILDGDAMSVVLPFETSMRYTVSEIRETEMALSFLVILALAHFAAKDSPYCERCRKPMEMATTQLRVSPLAVLYCLLKGYFPVALSDVRKIVDTKQFSAPQQMDEVWIQGHWCGSCGCGIVNAEVRFQHTSSRRPVPSVLFYSENWTGEEIRQRRRADAIEQAIPEGVLG